MTRHRCSRPGQLDTSRVLSSLRRCSRITELHLASLSVTSAQLADCFGGIPLLRFLTQSFIDDLDSLSFLTSNPLTSTLT